MRELTVERLDHLAVRVLAGEEVDQQPLVAAELCAYFEWYWLRSGGQLLGRLQKRGPFADLHSKLCSGVAHWSTAALPARGFIRVTRAHTDLTEANWIQFRYELQRSAVAAGFSATWAKEIVGAIGELEDNIHVHSRRARSGLLAYWIEGEELELVVLDQGIGVLESLREAPEFAHLVDHGTALRKAVQNGNSGYGVGIGRGWGFNDLFRGLANSKARIRLRSGDHVLSVDGQIGLPSASLRQCAPGNGFLTSVRVSSTRG